MTWWEKLLAWLEQLFKPTPEPVPIPTGPTGPTGPRPTGPTAVTGPTGPTPIAVRASTPFRALPIITLSRLTEILKGFPLGSETDAIWRALGGRPLPVAQSWMESRYGQDENAQRAHNPLGLLWYQGSPTSDYIVVGDAEVKLLVFPTWAAAFAEWARRMDDPTYKGGVYMPTSMALEQMIVTYVGGPGCWSSQGGMCANGETWQSVQHYLTETVNRLNRYYGIATPAPVPSADWVAHDVDGSGSPLMLPRGLRFRKQITPKGVINTAVGRPNRTGAPLDWKATTQHGTGNRGVGADAAMHATWQKNGTPGRCENGVCFVVAVHFYVDDKEVVQCLPVNEEGIHAGEPRNSTNVAVELCINADRNVARAEENSIALQAGLLNILGKNGTQGMDPHTPNASGHCPQISTTWSEWERRVDAAVAAIP